MLPLENNIPAAGRSMPEISLLAFLNQQPSGIRCPAFLQWIDPLSAGAVKLQPDAQPLSYAGILRLRIWSFDWFLKVSVSFSLSWHVSVRDIYFVKSRNTAVAIHNNLPKSLLVYPYACFIHPVVELPGCLAAEVQLDLLAGGVAMLPKPAH